MQRPVTPLILSVVLFAGALEDQVCAQTLQLRQPAKPVASSNPAPAAGNRDAFVC